MKRSIFTFSMLAAFSLSLMLLLEPNEISAGDRSYKLADTAFAGKMCWAWNNWKWKDSKGKKTTLAQRLGATSQGGSGWVDVKTGVSEVPAGYQKIVSGRRDCNGWPRFQLVIKKNELGEARCTAAGSYNNTKMTWQFLPTSDNWFNYGQGFGMGAFMALWKTMEGKESTAFSNRGDFGLFFRMGAYFAVRSDYLSGCNGISKAKVKKAACKFNPKKCMK